MGGDRQSNGRKRCRQRDCLYPYLQGSDGRAVAQLHQVCRLTLCRRTTLTLSQLQFEEGDRHGRAEKPGSNLLSELASTIAVFH